MNKTPYYLAGLRQQQKRTYGISHIELNHFQIIIIIVHGG
jgi:hypothetical protein